MHHDLNVAHAFLLFIPAVSEVFEETGYSVKVEDLVKVRSYKSGVGSAASTQNIYYVEVCQCNGA